MFRLLKGSMFACLIVMLMTITVKASHSDFHSVDPDSLNKYDQHQDKLTALDNYLNEHGLTIEDKLQDPRFKVYDGISDRFKGSAEKKSLDLESYKKVLGFEDKSRRIVNFINTHEDKLQRAQEKYDIPKYVISAIIGVESDFGAVTGNYNPFNVYVSMYIENYRDDFARSQLKELLIFTERNNIDVFELKSSYAGAMTFAQFIPYSMNKWFVGKDISDMNNNIQSVANYLAYFKERTGSLETAVLRYNPSSLYTKAVLDLAHEAEQYFLNSSN